MKDFCQNEYCENPGAKVVPVSVEKPSDQQRTFCVPCEEAYTIGVQHATKTLQAAEHAGLRIDPPPKAAKGQPLFRVIYTIDIPADSPSCAARQTHQILLDPDSLPPVVDVLDHRGRVRRIDLSHSRRLRQKGGPS
jgi:hypothetical protein